MIDSNWLLIKVKTASSMPEQSLLALFDLLLEIPDQEKPLEIFSVGSTALLLFLTEQAKMAGLDAPELFAQQIFLMANHAYIKHRENPDAKALYHAKQAATALLKVQRKSYWRLKTPYALSAKPVQYGLAATLSLLIGSFIFLGYQGAYSHNNSSSQASSGIVTVAEAGTQSHSANSSTLDNSMASPSDTAEMFSTIEKMRDGRCRYIEALQLPTAQQGIYMQNVVAGQVSNKASDQKTARELMGKVTCDYTPMLMKNSKG